MTVETKGPFKARPKHDWVNRARDIVAMRRVAAQHGDDKNILDQQREVASILRREALDLLAFCLREAPRFNTDEVLENLKDYHQMIKILDGEAD